MCNLFITPLNFLYSLRLRNTQGLFFLGPVGLNKTTFPSHILMYSMIIPSENVGSQ